VGGRAEIGRHLGGVVGVVLVVLVQRDRPGHLLWARVDVGGPSELGDGIDEVAGDLADGPIRSQRHPLDPTVVVFDHRLVGSQIQCDHQRPGPVVSRQGCSFPASGR
jgi:hypothetical protein